LLDSVEGLRNLERAQAVTIVGPITTLAGLRKLTSVTSLGLQATRLTSLEGLGPVVFEAGGSLGVFQNPLLKSLAAFGGQATKLDVLTISDNAQLQDLAGLESLQNVGSSIQLTGNRVLTSMHGLENLTNVQSLDIEQNAQLTTLSALGSVTRLYSLAASGNPRLPTCEVRALFRRAGGQDLYVSGNNNAATCP
jgi:Leucine-rich repeat (LRR) protein